jgi:heme exporter protein D
MRILMPIAALGGAAIAAFYGWGAFVVYLVFLVVALLLAYAFRQGGDLIQDASRRRFRR